MDLQWLVVGGGVHGTFLSHSLMNHAQVAPSAIGVIDPHEAPLAMWTHCTKNVGMSVLRSTIVHHLDLNPFALRKYAKSCGLERSSLIGAYQRPALALFNEHSRYVIEANNLLQPRIKGWVKQLNRTKSGWRAETSIGTITAKNIVLALGMSDNYAFPDWVQAIRSTNASVWHLLEPTYSEANIGNATRITIIGAGSSALQAAMYHGQRHPGSVVLSGRKALEISPFDAEPGWMGPKYLSDFWKIREPDVRRSVIRQARKRGTAPEEVVFCVRNMIRKGLIQHVQDEITAATFQKEGLRLRTRRGISWQTDALLCGTGYTQDVPGGVLVCRLALEEGLPTATCGFPIVDKNLAWAKGLFVTGALAELEVGPVSRNILGARMAGERIAGVLDAK